jgi:hypothetical protein
MPNVNQIRGLAPYFIVRDLVVSVEYYHTALGFAQPTLWGQPPVFAMPSREGFIIMLKQADSGMTIVPTERKKSAGTRISGSTTRTHCSRR